MTDKPKTTWQRRRVVELMLKVRAGLLAAGEVPSAVVMAELVHKHLWRRFLRGEERATEIVSHLLRASLVQLAGTVNRDAEKLGYTKQGRSSFTTLPAVARRDEHGQPTGIRETPSWKEYTEAQLLESRNRMSNQINGLNDHLAQMDFVLALFRKHTDSQTVEEVCAAAGVDPYALDLDKMLSSIAI